MARLSTCFTAGAVLLLLVLAGLTAGVPTADAASCHYLLGFKAFHHRIAPVVGPCVGDEQHNPVNGDAFQQTKFGTLVWRKADNQIAFTNGYITILSTARGMEERRNTQRFASEANPDGLPVVADVAITSAQLRRQFTGTAPAPNATCTTRTSRSVATTAKVHKAGKSKTTHVNKTSTTATRKAATTRGEAGSAHIACPVTV